MKVCFYGGTSKDVLQQNVSAALPYKENDYYISEVNRLVTFYAANNTFMCMSKFVGRAP